MTFGGDVAHPSRMVGAHRQHCLNRAITKVQMNLEVVDWLTWHLPGSLGLADSHVQPFFLISDSDTLSIPD